MDLALGIIIGLLVAVFLAVILVLLRVPAEKALTVIKKQVDKVAPRERGYIVEPISQAEEVREDIIEKNRKAGRDTRIEELR